MSNRHLCAALAAAPVALAAPTASHAFPPGPALFGVNSEGVAMEVDLATGRATRVSGVGLEGYRNVGAMTFNSVNGVLYGADYEAAELLTIDVATRQGTPIGGIGFSSIRGLAFHAASATMYAIQDDVNAQVSDKLVRIDLATGQGTLVGELGFQFVQSLAVDPGTGTLYAVDAGVDKLLTINRTTGQATVVGAGPLGYTFVTSLAVHPTTRTLYGIDSQSDQLITINKTTGVGTGVGTLGFSDVRSIAFHPASAALYGMDAATGQLLSIATAPGPSPPLGTSLGPLGYTNIRGLVYLRAETTIYATEVRNDTLCRINPVTGLGSVVGPLVRADNGERIFEMLSLAWKPFAPQTLYGADVFRKKLFTIDRSNGRCTEMADLKADSGQIIQNLRCMTYDTHLRTLWGVDYDGTNTRLYKWIPATLRWTLVGTVAGYSQINGLIYVPNYSLFAGSAVATDGSHKLIGIRKNATVPFVMVLAFGPVYGLCYDQISGMLAGTTGSNLYVINTLNGQPTTVGALGAQEVEGLAWDPDDAVLYATNIATASLPAPQLIRINRLNGQGTVVGAVGFQGVAGLAFDRKTSTLYGSDVTTHQLVTIDASTGQGTAVAVLRVGAGPPIAKMAGLAFDAGTLTLWGVDTATDKLYRIDRATGLCTPAPQALGFSNVEGLEFDSRSGLYGTDSISLQLIRIDTATGRGTLVGSSGYKVNGLGGPIR